MFEKNFLMPQSNVIKHHRMLMNLTDISYMRNHWHTILSSQKAHGKKFAHTAPPGAVRLKKIYHASSHVVLKTTRLGTCSPKARDNGATSPASFYGRGCRPDGWALLSGMAAYVQSRADAFHVLNQLTWENPSVTNDNTGGGDITGPKVFQNNTPDARFFQLSLKYAFQPTPGRAKYRDLFCYASCDPVRIRNFLPHARLRGLNLPCNMQLLR